MKLEASISHLELTKCNTRKSQQANETLHWQTKEKVTKDKACFLMAALLTQVTDDISPPPDKTNRLRRRNLSHQATSLAARWLDVDYDGLLPSTVVSLFSFSSYSTASSRLPGRTHRTCRHPSLRFFLNTVTRFQSLLHLSSIESYIAL